VTTAIGRWLICDAGMISTIGQALDGFAAAEEEIRRAWIADRPMALAFGQLKNRTALPQRDDVFNQLGLRLEFRLIAMQWCQRRFTPNPGPPNRLHLPMGARVALPRPGGRWTFCPPRRAEPMHLSDHRVAGNAAELRRNLTRRQSVAPQLLEEFHTFVRPVHGPPSFVPGQPLDGIRTSPAANPKGR